MASNGIIPGPIEAININKDPKNSSQWSNKSK